MSHVIFLKACVHVGEVLYGIEQFTILSVVFEMGEDFEIAMAKYTLQLHCPLMDSK